VWGLSDLLTAVLTDVTEMDLESCLSYFSPQNDDFYCKVLRLTIAFYGTLFQEYVYYFIIISII
jgi:hypothetical protein